MSLCYQEAYRQILDGDYPEDSIKLVHGYPRLQVDTSQCPAGTLYGHAWLELSDLLCWDPTKNKMVLKEDYYVLGKIQEDQCMKYSRQEAIKMALKTGVYGPWENVPAEAQFKK